MYFYNDYLALLLQSIFTIFISVIGLLGSYTYWKPIILMVSLLSALSFVSHAYVAKQFLDIQRFADRDMAISWWDIYSDETIMAFQEKVIIICYYSINFFKIIKKYTYFFFHF